MPAWSATESRYKISIMTAHNEDNWCWYNYIDQNNLPYEKVKEGMLGRLKKHLNLGKHPCKIQALIVYEKTIFKEKLSLSVLL